MRPFDLEAFKKGAIAVRSNRTGRFRFVGIMQNSEYPLVTEHIVEPPFHNTTACYKLNGGGVATGYDLAMEEIEHTRYVNIYRSFSGQEVLGKLFLTKEQAALNWSTEPSFQPFVAVAKLTWTE